MATARQASGLGLTERSYVCVSRGEMKSIFPAFRSRFWSAPTPEKFVLIHIRDLFRHRFQIGVPFEAERPDQPMRRMVGSKHAIAGRASEPQAQIKNNRHADELDEKSKNVIPANSLHVVNTSRHLNALTKSGPDFLP
jgi:hypothetical protein